MGRAISEFHIQTRNKRTLIITTALLAGIVIALAAKLFLSSSTNVVKFERNYPYKTAILPVRINGQGPYRFLLDTGSALGKVTLSSELAKAVGVGPSGTATPETGIEIIGENAFYPSTVHAFQLGNTKPVKDIDIMITPALSTLRTRYGIEGLIGITFFNGATVTLDCRKATLDISREKISGTGLPIDYLSGGVPAVMVTVDGKPARFLLDTGSEACWISEGMVKTLGLTRHWNPVDEVNYVTVKNLIVGSAERDNVEIAVGGFVEMFDSSETMRADGILGMSFLSNFLLKIDCIGDRLSITPVSND